jgi:hypothetical protein
VITGQGGVGSLQFFWPVFNFFHYEWLFCPVVLTFPVSISPFGCISLLTIEHGFPVFDGVFACGRVLISLFVLRLGTCLEVVSSGNQG